MVCAALVFGAAQLGGVALGQSGHFITGGAGAPVCVVNDDFTVTCTGKVAGLGGTTFEITLIVNASATWDCINPSGNPGESTPGQADNLTAEGTTGELATPRNGQYVFTITTGGLDLGKMCPGDSWTVANFSVTFSDATLTLLEDDTQSDQVIVPLSGVGG
jgi:hypothetical protein